MDDADWDWYKLLRVREDATDEEIRAGYRRQARIWHTDTNSSPEAAERMRLINLAYEVLSDPGRRAAYDDRLRREEVDAAGPPVIEVSPASLDFGTCRLESDDPGPERHVQLFNRGGTARSYDLAVARVSRPWSVQFVASVDDDAIAVASVRFEPTAGFTAGMCRGSIIFMFCHPDTEETISAAEVEMTAQVEVRRSAPAPVATPGPPPAPASTGAMGAAGLLVPLLFVLAGLALVALPFGVMAIAIPVFHFNDRNSSVLSVLAMLIIGPACFVGLLAAVFVGLPMCLSAAWETLPRRR